MSKNFDQNFSLKDWVTKRAANMPEAVEEDTVLQVQNGVDLVMRHEKVRMPEPPQAEEIETETNDDTNQQHKMTARISNGIASTVPASPTQQIQIVRLLRDLGDRLRQSEKEREILWKELDSCRKLLTDIEDKTSNTEKAYLTIEHKLNAQGQDIKSLSEKTDNAQALVSSEDTEDAKQFRKVIEDKINALETTTGSAVLRLEDAVSENSKLARRLEQVTQDRAQLINRIEEMQETLAETQDTLRAKALVLLTDHALASKTTLPQTPAWSGNDTLRTQAAPAPSIKPEEAFGLENRAWWKNSTSMSMNKGMLASLIALGLVGGWAVSKAGMPSFNFVTPAEKMVPEIDLGAALNPPAEKVTTENNEGIKTAALTANQIEPGNANDVAMNELSPSVSSIVEESTSDNAETQATLAETKAREIFDAAKPAGALSQRIKADNALPASVKAIEKKALNGDAEAQHDLAAIYTAGHAGVKTDYPKAALWFSEAAHNGIANAQYNLAVLYHQGLGVKQDTKQAIDLYRIAAASNHPEAQYNLGIAHIEGIGADYNPQIAAHYFQKAAAGGVVEAAYNLGLIQENGLLGEAQPDEAVFWYKLAANRGNEQAKEALSQLAKQLDMTGAEIDGTFKKISDQKPEYAKSLNVPAKAAEVKPAAATPAAKAVAKTAPPAPSKQAVANNAPVPLAAPAYDPVIVAQIQEQLIRLGLFSGSADGTADKGTQEAVRSYQSMNKLKADGRPTEDVLVHMLASEMQIEPSSN